jgi:hypothetical protein
LCSAPAKETWGIRQSKLQTLSIILSNKLIRQQLSAPLLIA